MAYAYFWWTYSCADVDSAVESICSFFYLNNALKWYDIRMNMHICRIWDEFRTYLFVIMR